MAIHTLFSYGHFPGNRRERICQLQQDSVCTASENLPGLLLALMHEAKNVGAGGLLGGLGFLVGK